MKSDKTIKVLGVVSVRDVFRQLLPYLGVCECGKIFLKGTKHDKQSCSNRCGARKRMRELRAERKKK